MLRAQKSRPTLSLDPVPSADGDGPQGPSVVDAADAASETLPEVAPEQPIEALAKAPTPIIEQAEPKPFGDGAEIDRYTGMVASFGSRGWRIGRRLPRRIVPPVAHNSPRPRLKTHPARPTPLRLNSRFLKSGTF